MSDAYSVDVTRQALASWERRKQQAVARWGSLDRLAAKCNAETSAKFARAGQRFKDARHSGDEFELARRAGVMERGVDALEEEAIKNGYSPSDMTWFDLKIKVKGKKAAAVLDPKDADYVAAQLSKELGEDVIVYTVSDIILMAHENPTALTHLKHTMGAYTTHVDVRDDGEAPW